ncbi:NAD(P)/FAD-dependent oxidoreductase [Thermotalea metallivorans]|uniref:L-2-hydroxyglutarate oxidase LhgO n=1 Tax=Thermotalea metallivorans TaxID=520762 RepID=A0A140KZF1_9FIRM|nr:NAD(P)/FAD-dependent oxidoreductase [Thermotalea metallivorans]KXG73676.1 L-2-hydroxyglutarate oxidase LhgO [Thermotalea metallivorans]
MYDVAIIGAGVVGCSIARELSRYDLKTVLIEKDTDVANGTTKANSAIVHSGYDAKPGSLKAKLNVQGNALFDQICKELDVPFQRIGSLVLAFEEEEMKIIRELYEKGLANGVPQMEILGKEQILALEPNVNDRIIGGLYAPTAGIVGPWELAIALAENAVENGVELRLESQVTNIEKQGEGYRISMEGQQIDARYVINCAGVYADEIHNMVAAPSFKIVPRRGQYNIFDKSVGNFVSKVIFQCPTKLGKGVLIAPTVHGNLLVGPDAENVDCKESRETTMERLAFIREQARKSAPNLPYHGVITAFAGLRATPDTGDFIIEEAKDAKGFIDVAGIESPGLSAAPAIAVYVAEILKNMGAIGREKWDFHPMGRKMIRFMELSDAEKAEIIKRDPRYGRIICRCENITEGEIVDAIHRKVGARNMDGIKRRVRPGSGRCQGGFCSPRVMEIIARELKMDMTEVVKDNPKSYILIGPAKSSSVLRENLDAAAASKTW